MTLDVDPRIDESDVQVDADGGRIRVNDEEFGMVILATGVTTDPLSNSLYRSVHEHFGAPTVDGLPHVSSSLRWVEGEDLFVVGANAVLELGPGGGNLMGAMRRQDRLG